MSSQRLRNAPLVSAPPDQLNHAAVARFAAIPQVAYIFCDLYQAGPVFTVLVEGENYDDAVMDQLLDIELALHLQFAPASLTFSYIPHAVGTDPRQTVRATAQRLFEREHGRSD